MLQWPLVRSHFIGNRLFPRILYCKVNVGKNMQNLFTMEVPAECDFAMHFSSYMFLLFYHDRRHFCIILQKNDGACRIVGPSCIFPSGNRQAYQRKTLHAIRLVRHAMNYLYPPVSSVSLICGNVRLWSLLDHVETGCRNNQRRNTDKVYSKSPRAQRPHFIYTGRAVCRCSRMHDHNFTP
jgi:hypothetical protein